MFIVKCLYNWQNPEWQAKNERGKVKDRQSNEFKGWRNNWIYPIGWVEHKVIVRFRVWKGIFNDQGEVGKV